MKYKLPKRFKDRWIKALLSGKFQQGRYYLQRKHENTYCCLGVAGKICGIENMQGENLFTGSLKGEATIKGLPELLTGDAEENPLIEKLTVFNDSGKSFKWIAAYIKRYL